VGKESGEIAKNLRKKSKRRRDLIKQGVQKSKFKGLRLHVQGEHKIEKQIPNAGQVVEIAKKALAQRAQNEKARASTGKQSGCLGWHLVCSVERLSMEAH
jgi:hypothetical protein